VQINTPHTLHFQQIMDSLDAGLHVLTEKPMVCTTRDAHKIIDKANQTGKTLMISYQRHFQPEYRIVADLPCGDEVLINGGRYRGFLFARKCDSNSPA
jgi:predicted dehydrogenase